MTMLTNPKDIQAWLNEHKIENYTINSDLTVDVEGDVKLFSQKLTSFPVKFNTVTGDFICWQNKLTSLNGSPKKLGGSFNCNNNELISLLGVPQDIEGSFSCAYNKLTSLEFCPTIVGGIFMVAYNDIRSLEFCPDEVGRNAVWLNDNPSLGEFQEVNDFSFIKAEHLRIRAILDESKKLNQLLERPVDSQRVAFKL